MRALLLLTLAWLAACDDAPTPPAPEEPRPTSPTFDRAAPLDASGPPDRAELFLILHENADVPLSLGAHCDGVVGLDLERPPVLGDWVAYNLSVLEGPPIELPASCRDEGDVWTCEVEFSTTADPEAPWTWGVRFDVRKSDRRPIPGSLLCTGAG